MFDTKKYYLENKAEINRKQKLYYHFVPRNEMQLMRHRLYSIIGYTKRVSGTRTYEHQKQVREDFTNYKGMFSNDPIQEVYFQAERQKIISGYSNMETQTETKAKKKLTLLQRKTKKIESDLAKLAAKAEAFKAKLAAGYVVEIAEHKFE